MQLLLKLLVVTVFTNSFAITVIAQTPDSQPIKIKPGLWSVEHFVTREKGSPMYNESLARKEKLLASLPPERRTEMEAALGDLSAPISLGGGKFCVSPDKAQRGEVPLQGGSCKSVHAEGNGNAMRYSFTCSDGDKTRGDGTVTFTSETTYNAHIQLLVMQGGKLENLNGSSSGRFISSDCGIYKP